MRTGVSSIAVVGTRFLFHASVYLVLACLSAYVHACVHAYLHVCVYLCVLHPLALALLARSLLLSAHLWVLIAQTPAEPRRLLVFCISLPSVLSPSGNLA